MSFSRGSSFRCKIAYLGLFAILLLTFGPVISQVRAVLVLNNSMFSPMNHHQLKIHSITLQTKAVTVSIDQHITSKSIPLHHFMSLCGYCDLAHHSPLISYDNPLIIQSFSPVQSFYPLYIVDYCPSFYSKGLSRAPPVKLTSITNNLT